MFQTADEAEHFVFQFVLDGVLVTDNIVSCPSNIFPGTSDIFSRASNVLSRPLDVLSYSLDVFSCLPESFDDLGVA